MPLSRGSNGRFELRRFRAKPYTKTGLSRAALFHSRLPPSLGLRSVPSPVSHCFFSLPLKWKKKQADAGRKMG